MCKCAYSWKNMLTPQNGLIPLIAMFSRVECHVPSSNEEENKSILLSSQRILFLNSSSTLHLLLSSHSVWSSLSIAPRLLTISLNLHFNLLVLNKVLTVHSFVLIRIGLTMSYRRKIRNGWLSPTFGSQSWFLASIQPLSQHWCTTL